MHDIHSQTLEALPGILELIAQRDLQAICLAELLAAKYG
jgi:hypothetical protein